MGLIIVTWENCSKCSKSYDKSGVNCSNKKILTFWTKVKDSWKNHQHFFVTAHCFLYQLYSHLKKLFY